MHIIPPPRGGGGGTRLSFGRGGAAGGRKPDPVTNHSARKKYTLSQYTLLKLSLCIPCISTDGLSILQKIHPVPIYLTKTFICIPCISTDGLSIFCCVSSYIHKNLLGPARAVAGARSRGSRACHKHCGPARVIFFPRPVPHASLLVPRLRACHKHCGLGSREATL